MRVNGASRSLKTQSANAAQERQKRDVSARDTPRADKAPRLRGHDAVSQFESKPAASTVRLSPPPPLPRPEPLPSAPAKDLKRGDAGKEVAALQEQLVQLGYLTKEQVATGPGAFGPRTEAALKQFQQERGLPADGQYTASTREALAKASPRRSGTGDAPGAAMSPEAAFITQFTSAYNPTGPRGSTNCGPASLAMSLAYTGHMPPGLTKEQQVDHARALMSPRRASEFTYAEAADGTRVPLLDRDRELTGGAMVSDGIQGAGLTSRYGQGWEALDSQLAAGDPVIANGQTNAAWRSQFPSRMGSGDIGHLNAILGKTAEGKYIVADPLHTGGPVEMTRAQLSVFFSPTGGQPSFNALVGASAPGVTTKGRVSAAGMAQTQDVAALAQADARKLETTLKTSLEQGARQFKELLRDNPDPVYQEALVRAAEPSLVKMGELFGGTSPEMEQMLRPPAPMIPPNLNDPMVSGPLTGRENNIKHETYYSLARAAEMLEDPAAGLVGEYFSRKLPPGVTNGPLLSAVSNSLGSGSRLAFDIERAMVNAAPVNTRPAFEADIKALHETVWSSVERIRSSFVAASEKANVHQGRIAELLSGPSRVLTPEQQQAAIDAFMTPERQQDLREFERLGQLLAAVTPDKVPARSDPRMDELARTVPALAETQAGAEYVASQLAQTDDGSRVFFDVVSNLNDGKDFTEHLAEAIVKGVGVGAIQAVSEKDATQAERLYEGLARHAHVFGMSPDAMRDYTDLLKTIKPSTREKQYQQIAEQMNELLREQSTGLPGNPETRQGQLIRGLGVAIATLNLAGDVTDPDAERNIATGLQVFGDVLSVGGDGASIALDALNKGSKAAKVAGWLSGAGGILGAAAEAIAGFEAVQEGKYFSATASGAQAVGGTILGASALVSVTPGLQLAGAALVVSGLFIKALDPDQAILQAEQLDLLRRSGMDPKLADALISSGGPDFLADTLGQGAGMSPQDIQRFLTARPEVAGHDNHVGTLAKAAAQFGVTGPHFEEFLVRLSEAHTGEDDLAQLSIQLNNLFFSRAPYADPQGNLVTTGDEFQQWVQHHYPDVAAWARSV